MINKLFIKIGSIPKDKILHFLIPYLVADVCFTLGAIINLSLLLTLLISILVPSVLILGKELLDQIRYKGWDNKDIIAGYVGVGVKLVLFLLSLI